MIRTQLKESKSHRFRWFLRFACESWMFALCGCVMWSAFVSNVIRCFWPELILIEVSQPIAVQCNRFERRGITPHTSPIINQVWNILSLELGSNAAWAWFGISFHLNWACSVYKCKPALLKLECTFSYATQFTFLVYHWNGIAIRWIEFRLPDMTTNEQENVNYTLLCWICWALHEPCRKSVYTFDDIFDSIGIMSTDILWAFRWFSFGAQLKWHFESISATKVGVAFCNRKYWTGINKRKKKKWRMKIRLTASDLFDSFGFGGNRRTKFCEF